MRASLIVVLLLVLPLALSTAEAQQRINPICVVDQRNCDYPDVYIVFGRILDGDGLPYERGTLFVSIQGVAGAPVRAQTDCKGDFIVPYEKYYKPDARKHKVNVLVVGREGQENATFSGGIDDFYRRSDILIRLPYVDSGITCPDDGRDVPFAHKITVKGRVLNRTAEYEHAGAKFHAAAFVGRVDGYWAHPDGVNKYCFLGLNNECESRVTDERGDFAFTWTFTGGEVPAGGKVVVKVGNDTYEAEVNAEFRVALMKIETTGQGPPPRDTPGLGLAALVAAAAVAIGGRSLLQRRHR